MAKITIKDHCIAIENLANDVNKLLEIKETNQKKIEGLLVSKLKEEAALAKAIETKVQNLTQIAKNWPKPFMMRCNYTPAVSETTIIHCKQCLASVVISRSTQTLPSFIRANKTNYSTSIGQQKPLRSILRNPASGKVPESSKCITAKETKIKKQPLLEWSAMEWNGKNEINEINNKIVGLSERIDRISNNNKEVIEMPIAVRSCWQNGTSAKVLAMEERLNQLEDDILYLDSSL